jgi:hypothetical protein
LLLRDYILYICLIIYFILFVSQLLLENVSRKVADRDFTFTLRIDSSCWCSVCVVLATGNFRSKTPRVLVVLSDAFSSTPFVSTLIALYFAPGVGVLFCTATQNMRSVFSFLFDHHYVSLVLYLVVSSRSTAREKSIVFCFLFPTSFSRLHESRSVFKHPSIIYDMLMFVRSILRSCTTKKLAKKRALN